MGLEKKSGNAFLHDLQRGIALVVPIRQALMINYAFNLSEKNETENLMNTRPRLVMFAIVILALSALSFHGALDRFARERVKDTTIETVAIYAVARAINAGVSVLQSTEVGVKIVGSVIDQSWRNPGPVK